MDVIDNPRHCSVSDYLSMVAWLRAIEAGDRCPVDVDWRTRCGVLATMLEHALLSERKPDDPRC